jgi:hypothetical protein
VEELKLYGNVPLLTQLADLNGDLGCKLVLKHPKGPEIYLSPAARRPSM